MKKYLIESSRVGLRCWEPDDLKMFSTINQDKEVMKYFPTAYWADEAMTQKYMDVWNDHYKQYGFTYFAADLLSENRFIGFIGTKKINFNLEDQELFDIGWRLDKDYWGRGLATEGALIARDHFFATSLENRLISIAPKLNIPSIHIMEKIGMKPERSFMHPGISNDSPLKDCMLYAIYRSEI